MPAIVRAVIEVPRSHTHAMGLKHVLIGEDPSDVEGLWARMYEASDYHGRRGVLILAISGIDMALWDIRAKVQAKPLCEILGRKKRDRLLAYGTIYPLRTTADEVKGNIDRGLKMGLRAINEQILDQGGIDIAQPDISMAGGFTEVLRIAQMAKARGQAAGAPLLQDQYPDRPPISPSSPSMTTKRSSNIPPATRRCAGN